MLIVIAADPPEIKASHGPTPDPHPLSKKLSPVVILGTQKLKLCQDFGPQDCFSTCRTRVAIRSDGAQHLFASRDLDIWRYIWKEMVKRKREVKGFPNVTIIIVAKSATIHDFLENSFK